MAVYQDKDSLDGLKTDVVGTLDVTILICMEIENKRYLKCILERKMLKKKNELF